LQPAQELLLQPLQEGPLPATARPPLWAKKTDICRVVFNPSQRLQGMGKSASLMERTTSKVVPQSVQVYS